MGMSPRERVLCALNRGQPDRVPYCELGIDEPLACQLLGEPLPMDRYWEAGEYIERAVEREKALSRVLGRDNICYQLRPPIPAHKHVGQANILFYGQGMIQTEADLDRLVLPDPYDEAFYQPVRLFLQEREEFATCAGCRLGVSPAYLAMGIEHFAVSLYDNPALVAEVLRRYSDWCAVVIERAIELGFDIIWTADDLAFNTGPLFSPDIFRRQILPHIRKVAEKITIPWIFHSDGDLSLLLDDLLPLGMQGLHPIEPQAMDIRTLKTRYGQRISLVGNVSVDTLAKGTPDQVRQEVKALLRDVAPGGGYILSSGNSLASYCRTENVRMLVDTVRQYGSYPIMVDA